MYGALQGHIMATLAHRFGSTDKPASVFYKVRALRCDISAFLSFSVFGATTDYC